MHCVLCIFLLYNNIYIDSTKAMSKICENWWDFTV